jgi:hypothetical protein
MPMDNNRIFSRYQLDRKGVFLLIKDQQKRKHYRLPCRHGSKPRNQVPSNWASTTSILHQRQAHIK